MNLSHSSSIDQNKFKSCLRRVSTDCPCCWTSSNLKSAILEQHLVSLNWLPIDSLLPSFFLMTMFIIYQILVLKVRLVCTYRDLPVMTLSHSIWLSHQNLTSCHFIIALRWSFQLPSSGMLPAMHTNYPGLVS